MLTEGFVFIEVLFITSSDFLCASHTPLDWKETHFFNFNCFVLLNLPSSRKILFDLNVWLLKNKIKIIQSV